MDSIFLPLALLTDDSSALLLAAEELRRRRAPKQPPIFNFHSLQETRFYTDFRFHKADIIRIHRAFGIPNIMRTRVGLKFSGLEGLCILLRRLAYPNRLTDLQLTFGRNKQDLSGIFNTVLDFIYANFAHLVTSFQQWWLQPPELQQYCNAIQAKGCVLDNCFGFIDGTIHATCRPTRNQREVYSGHKRLHGLKYQSIVTPNGLIANLYGPIPGRRHDSFMLQSSKLQETLANVGNFYLYGDSGYPLRRFLITPYQGNNLTPNQRAFNYSMSQMRIVVEWEFGELFEQFAFLDFKKNQKIYLQPVAKYVFVATILKNCKTCIYGSQTSLYFNLQPPSLESYLMNNRNL